MPIVKKLTINGHSLWQMRALQSISIKRFLTKRVYTQNENIDISGLIVEAHYDDGTSVELPAGSYTYSPVTATSADGESLTVKYAENNIEKTVTSLAQIIVKALASIIVEGELTTKTYNYGDAINVDGLSVVLQYNDGTAETKTSGFGWSPRVAETIGVNAIVVEFGEQSVELPNAFTVNRVLKNVEVLDYPKLVYLPNEICDKTGLRISATFTDSDPVTIDANSPDWSSVTINDNALTTEDKTVSISYTYNGTTKSTSIGIAVMTDIKVSSLPTKTRYKSGQTFRSDGIVVKGTYNDGQDRELSASDYTLSIANEEIIESTPQTSIPIYEETRSVFCSNGIYSDSFDITIDSIKDIFASAPTKAKYRVSEVFDPAGMVVTAKWTDNSRSTITDYTYSKVALTAASKSISISYKSKGVNLWASVQISMYRILTLNLVVNDPSISDNYPAGDLPPSVNNASFLVSSSEYGQTIKHYEKTIDPYGNSREIIEIPTGADKKLTITPDLYCGRGAYCGLMIFGLLCDGGTDVSGFPYLKNGHSYIFDLNNTADDINLTIYFTAYDYRYLDLKTVGRPSGAWDIRITNPNHVSVQLNYNTKMCSSGDAENWKNLNDVSTMDLSGLNNTTIRISENVFATHITTSFVENEHRFVTYAYEIHDNPYRLIQGRLVI